MLSAAAAVSMLVYGTTGSRVQTRPKPSDFSGEEVLSMPSFGGEVKRHIGLVFP
jgi:hypothetical protein